MSRLTFFCDLAEATTPLPHFWEHTVGSDHALMALRDDWQRDIKRAHDELGFRHVRFHGLLSDDMTRRGDGEPGRRGEGRRGDTATRSPRLRVSPSQPLRVSPSPLLSVYPNDGFENDGETEVQLFKSQRGIMREVAQNTRAHARGRPVYYTEWNTSSNPFDELHDEPYAAAAVASTVMEANGLVEGYSFWTFSDIFEEHGLPTTPFHGGFGLLTLHGIPKPTYRTFELLHDLGDRQSLVDGLHETVDCSVVQKESSVTVLLTNYTTPGHSIETEEIHIRLTNARESVAARIRRVDKATTGWIKGRS